MAHLKKRICWGHVPAKKLICCSRDLAAKLIRSGSVLRKKLPRCGHVSTNGRVRRRLVPVAALLLMLCVAMTAFAESGEFPDFGRAGSVTLTLEDSDGNIVTGGEITIYEVASLYLDDGKMAYALTNEFDDCKAEMDVTDTFLAAALEQYVSENHISGRTAEVGSDGTVTFDGLELGLYLVVQTLASDGGEIMNSFVVTVPLKSDGEWIYAVDASPKIEVMSSGETQETDETTIPEETTASEEESTEVEEPTDAEEVTETEASTEEEPTESTEEETTEAEEVTGTEETTEAEEPTDAEATTEAEESTEAEELTETVTTLPQTGQLNWPVPVLAVSGLLFFAAGWYLKESDRKWQGV